MKKKLFSIVTTLCLLFNGVNAQTTDLAPNYKVIDMGTGGYGDYTPILILLHEAYNGTPLVMNYAIGTVKALRGWTTAFDRTDVAQISCSSAYAEIHGSVISSSSLGLKWKLKTAVYNGKKYLALAVPYSAAYHNWGYQFAGWTLSSAENMKCVVYSDVSDVQDFAPSLNEVHDVSDFTVNGGADRGLIIGANNKSTKIYLHVSNGDYGYLNLGGNTQLRGNGQPSYFEGRVDVASTIHAKEVKVDLTGWSDFVFHPAYKLKPLSEVEYFIKTNGHLENIPSAEQVVQNGVSIGEMQAKLLQKVEELTLYSIEQEKKLQEQWQKNALLDQKLAEQAKQNEAFKQEIEQLKQLITQKLK